jgi:hypothetical protein
MGQKPNALITCVVEVTLSNVMAIIRKSLPRVKSDNASNARKIGPRSDAMQIEYDEYCQVLSKVCDILWRYRQGDMPLDNEEDENFPFRNTSAETREAVRYVFEVLGIECWDPEGKEAAHLEKIKAYQIMKQKGMA